MSDLISDLVSEMNKHATSSRAYLQGDHANHTWGVVIPHRAFQYLIGGSTVWPLQRYLGISGEKKSFKSTLKEEFGNWFIRQGGAHIDLDTENKTSPTMLDAMSRWWIGDCDQGRHIFKVCSSVGEWQTMISRAVQMARKTGDKPPGERVPIYISIDSLTARATEDEDRNLRKEGAAAERSFPVGTLQTTKFLEALNLLGTTCSVGWVQHMKQVAESGGYGGPQYKEKGASAAQFGCSTHIRVSKCASPWRVANYDGAPFPGVATEGFDIYLKATLSCVGPDNHTLVVPLCWQYAPQEDGTTRQAMWFDWDASLALLLSNMQYSDRFKPKLFKDDKARLKETVDFTEKKKNSITCAELGLENASYHAFGRAIEEHPEVGPRVSNFLNITAFPDVQVADIDFKAGDLASKK